MRYLVSAEEARRYDDNTINHLGVPSLLLMERAAIAVCNEILSFRDHNPFFRTERKYRVLILSGKGNNGADGLAVARILHEYGFDVKPVLVGFSDITEGSSAQEVACNPDISRYGTGIVRQLEMLRGYGIKPSTYATPECDTAGSLVIDDSDLSSFDIIVDAMLGVGCNRDLSGPYLSAVNAVNSARSRRGAELFVISVDVPTGLDSDNGRVCGAAVNADVTVTFAFAKRGLYLYPGCNCAGRVATAPIGITEAAFAGQPPEIACLTGTAGELLPSRYGGGNKGSFGKVLIIAGSRAYGGACILSSLAASRSGAGMVHVFTAEENRLSVLNALPSAILTTYNTTDEGTLSDPVGASAALTRALNWADAVVAGCGLSTVSASYAIIRQILTVYHGRLILDADALNLIAGSDELRRLAADYAVPGETSRFLIMTPHLGEFSRLYGNNITPSDVREHLFTWPKELAEEFHACILCKDARSITVSFDEELQFLNISGNDGMARGGSGDILAGLLGALACTGMNALRTAATGAFLHGLAGDRAAAKHGTRGMTVEDISGELTALIRQ